MKLTTENEFKGLMKEFFKRRIMENLGVESVKTARRANNPDGDYEDESEGDGVSYDESVDRARRGEDKAGDEPHDYPDEAEGPATTYEHLKFEASFYEGKGAEDDDEGDELDETNLYTDADKEGAAKVKETNLYTDADKEGAAKVKETNLYSDADKEGSDDTKKKGKSHAAERGAKGNFPGPPAGLTAGRIPRLREVFAGGSFMIGLSELAAIQAKKK